MTAQKREAGRNYIGLLHEEAEEQRIADMSAAAEQQSASTEEMASAAADLLQRANRLSGLMAEFRT